MTFKFQTKEHYLGDKYKAYNVVDENGTVFGTIQQYGGYRDTKSKSSRIVSSRKNVLLWSYTRNGETSYGHSSRKAAMESMTWMVR